MSVDSPGVSSIIAVLVGMAVPEGREFGAAIKGHNLGTDQPFGQEVKAVLLPTVQPETVDLLGIAPFHTDGVF
jgi:hypothetical protein